MNKEKMKKNTQLRRLNKVLHNGEIKTIDLISPGYVAFIEDRNEQSIFGEWVDLDDINFVELSEEILLKCSFLDFEGWLQKEGIQLFNINSLYYRANFPIKADIKYLHQLQNLYFALTNQELEIKQ